MSLFSENTESTEESQSVENQTEETRETQPVNTESQGVGEATTEQTTEQTTEGGDANTEVDPREAVASIGEQYGYDPEALGGFETPEAAEAAIKYRAEQLAKVGLASDVGQSVVDTPSPQHAPPAESTANAGGIDLKALGLDEDDPAAQAIRALESKVNQTAGLSEQIAQAVQVQQQQARQQYRNQVQQSAESIVSSFESPQFGTSGNRTAAQEWNVLRLYDLADAIALGAHRQGLPVPPMQQRLNQARLLFGDSGGKTQPQSTEEKKLDALPINRQTNRAEVPGMTMTSKWSENPDLLAAIKG